MNKILILVVSILVIYVIIAVSLVNYTTKIVNKRNAHIEWLYDN